VIRYRTWWSLSCEAAPPFSTFVTVIEALPDEQALEKARRGSLKIENNRWTNALTGASLLTFKDPFGFPPRKGVMVMSEQFNFQSTRNKSGNGPEQYSGLAKLASDAKLDVKMRRRDLLNVFQMDSSQMSYISGRIAERLKKDSKEYV
jgi:hypothetical protein